MVVGRSKSKSLRSGRPPLSASQRTSLSSKATRTIIRSHHTLQKDLAQAVAKGDETRAAKLKSELELSGGLKSYQLASTLGQSAERGGDTSRILVEWLQHDLRTADDQGKRLRLLEVGALSTKNACSNVACLDVERIDLQSNEPGIREVDFMMMEIPGLDSLKYDVVSLSLVLNYVPTAQGRGDMLKRISSFLRSGRGHHSQTESDGKPDSCFLPCLFLVLPLPCLTNSRYLDTSRLRNIMKNLGYDVAKTKMTTKLYYELYNYTTNVGDQTELRQTSCRKREVRKGGSRNNFAIVLDASNHRQSDDG